MAAAASSAVPGRFSGIGSDQYFTSAGSLNAYSLMGVSMKPGMTMLTRMLSWA